MSRKVLIFDLTNCEILSAQDSDILFILQKAFRTAIRIWNGYPLTSSEKLMKDNNIVLFPFPYSKNSKTTYRLVFQIYNDNSGMFNVNEQQAFHYLSKDIAQKTIPVCFALDYAQAIGDRGDVQTNYLERVFSPTAVLKQEFKTVFRNSPQIAELCAAITASGPDLFNLQDFINPYKDVRMSFTAREEELCTKPQMFMYENDHDMISSLKEHVDTILNGCHCNLGDIAIIPFAEDILDQSMCEQIVGKKVVSFSGRNSFAYEEADREKKRIMMLSPENVNGLEFQGIILLGVDEGRVPQYDSIGISVNYLRYSALNKLYLACSRAKYKLFILGTIPRGDSSCLQYALQNNYIERIECSHG